MTALTTAPSAAHDDQGKPSSGFKMPAGFIFGLGAVLYVSSLCSYLGLRFLVNGTILTALWTGGRLLKSTSRLSAGSWLVATVLVIAGAVASYLGYPPLGLLAQILWP